MVYGVKFMSKTLTSPMAEYIEQSERKIHNKI